MGQQRKNREWLVAERDYETEEEFRAAVEQRLVDIFAISFYSGRGVIVSPLRAKVDGEYRTLGFHFEETFIPAVRLAQPEASEPEPEPPALSDELTQDELDEHFPPQEPVEAT